MLPTPESENSPDTDSSEDQTPAEDDQPAEDFPDNASNIETRSKQGAEKGIIERGD